MEEVPNLEEFAYWWLQNLHDKNSQNMDNIKNAKYSPFETVREKVVRTIFIICNKLEQNASVRYMSVLLFDRFINNSFLEIYDSLTDKDKWEEMLEKNCAQINLRIVSCIQIASKMDSNKTCLFRKQLLEVLRWVDRKHEYSDSVVFKSELTVWRTLNFYVPSYTILDCCETLLAIVGLKNEKDINKLLQNVLDVVFLKHEKIFQHLLFMSIGKFPQSEEEKITARELQSNDIFLASTVVLALMFIRYCDEESIKIVAVKLAQLADSNDSDLTQMANIIFSIVLE